MTTVWALGGRHVDVIHADWGDSAHVLHNLGPLDAPLDGVRFTVDADEG